MNPLQSRVNSNSSRIEERFIDTVLLIALEFPQYTIEYIRDEMPIPIFLSIINMLNKKNKKK